MTDFEIVMRISVRKILPSAQVTLPRWPGIIINVGKFEFYNIKFKNILLGIA